MKPIDIFYPIYHHFNIKRFLKLEHLDPAVGPQLISVKSAIVRQLFFSEPSLYEDEK